MINSRVMRRFFLKAACVSLLVLPLIPPPAGAQLAGTDTAPNTPCTAKGAVRATANPDPNGTGAYVLTCDADIGHWRATINVTTPTEPDQAANKAYVDAAIAAGTVTACTNDITEICALERTRAANDPDFIPENIADGVSVLGVIGTYVPPAGYPPPYPYTGPNDCPEIGDLCPDGTVFAGLHPLFHEHLYIPTTDQSSSPVKWSESNSNNGAKSVDDGRINSDLIPNDPNFPSFKLCKDLTAGGHSDWYLPSPIEFHYLYSILTQIHAKGNITDFSGNYWTSYENVSSQAYYQGMWDNGNSTAYNKDSLMNIRCIRR